MKQRRNASLVLLKKPLRISVFFLLIGSFSFSALSEELTSTGTYTGSALDLASPSDSKRINQAYLDLYDLLVGESRQQVEYFNGTTSIDDYQISSHVFLPENPIGTLFILHGYFDHVGTLSYMINAALENRYAVFAYDLPGHGKSAGERGDISGFNNNAVLLNNIAAKYSRSLPKPYHLVGFSTGGSIALEHTQLSSQSPFDKTVLVSPLIRHTHWGWGKFAYGVFSPFLKTVRSRPKKNSSNAEYLAFAKTDPLRNNRVSFRFLKDLYQWNKELKKASSIDADILVVQGESDKVVKWKYNLPLLKSKANKLKIHTVPEGKHQLFNEVETMRKEVFAVIFNYLESEPELTIAELTP